ncbi:MAG: TetR/AcrR family transcriptional regulator [Mycobacterium sp.]|nr:TetR/AcrR family transcriptional regulator [Mycobacterium sp.]
MTSMGGRTPDRDIAQRRTPAGDRVGRIPGRTDRRTGIRAEPRRRSDLTRQEIIDAAVDLFTARGYGETRLQDIVKGAHVTTGAFYYHFDSKAALASAIMAQGWPKALITIDGCLSQSSSPGLERVILMTFALSSLMKQDRSVWIANHLNQAFGQLNDEGRRSFQNRAQQFIAKVAAALSAEDLRPEVTAQEVGSQVWITVHGCHLLSDALDDDVIQRLARSWQTLLPGIVPAQSLAYFERFVDRTAGAVAAGLPAAPRPN